MGGALNSIIIRNNLIVFSVWHILRRGFALPKLYTLANEILILVRQLRFIRKFVDCQPFITEIALRSKHVLGIKSFHLRNWDIEDDRLYP